MRKYFNKQNGSITMLGLVVMVFLSIIIAGLAPMVSAQISASVVNKELIEAQFAAEAGVKRAIVALANSRTDWNSWAYGGIKNDLSDDTTNKYYTVKIYDSNGVQLVNTAPVAGMTYTITSDGYVNNKHKGVVVKVTTATSTSGVYKYAAFSNGTLYVNSGSNQTRLGGDISSNTYINLNWSPAGMVSGYAYAPSGQVYAGNGIKKVTSGDAKIAGDQGKIDIASLTPAMPTFSMTGTDLKSTWTSGQWSGSTYNLTESNYYYNGNYDLNGHNYSIPDGKNVTIYVNGTFNLMSGYKITGGSLTVYATNGIVFSGGSIQAGTNGVVKLYTPGSLIDHANSYINASEVDVLAQSSVTLDGGSINQSLDDAVTKIYTRDFTINNSSSVISGNGIGEVVASNNISITDGRAPTTLMIAGNNISAKANNQTTVAGLYANGTIEITSITVLYDSTISSSLNLGSGTAGTGSNSNISINSWNNS